MKPVFLSLLCSIIFPVLLLAQHSDTTAANKSILTDSLTSDTVLQKNDTGQSLYHATEFLNTTDKPVQLQVSLRKQKSKEALFYLLAGLVLVLAFFRYFFARYFNNLFRVFFNTSLRQSQITDQLLQAKLPSLLYNLFFVAAGGIYIYSLLNYYQWIKGYNSWLVIGLCTGLLGMIYLVKFGTLKFTGWLTGFSDTVNTYLFILFLISKIIGIFLIPFIILMTFSDKAIVDIAVIISLLLIGFLFVMRFLRSYGIIQNQLKISKFHFFLYIIGLELLPLLLIYKSLMVLLSNKL